MAHTPLTDAQESRRKDGAPMGRVVGADFARRLETDRAELLDALGQLVRAIDHDLNLIEELTILSNARAAINKATGEE